MDSTYIRDWQVNRNISYGYEMNIPNDIGFVLDDIIKTRLLLTWTIDNGWIWIDIHQSDKFDHSNLFKGFPSLSSLF